MKTLLHINSVRDLYNPLRAGVSSGLFAADSTNTEFVYDIATVVRIAVGIISLQIFVPLQRIIVSKARAHDSTSRTRI